MRRTFVSLTLVFLGVLDAVGATRTSVKLSFTSPTAAAFTDSEDWLYAIVQTSDGGFLAGGYADLHASVLKLDAGMTRQWEKVFTGDEGGYILDVIETPSFYVASGNIGSDLLVVTASKNNPLNVTSYRFSPSALGLAADVNSVDGLSIRNVTGQSGMDLGYVILGRADRGGDAPGQRFSSFLLRLNPSFIRTGGLFPLLTASGEPAVCYTVRVTHSAAGAVSGFITAGTLPAPPEIDAGDIFVESIAANATGDFIASKTLRLTADQLALGADFRQPLCDIGAGKSLASSNARAWDIVEIGDGGDFAVSAATGIYEGSATGCVNSRLTSGYTDMRVLLLRLSPSLGVRWAKEIGRFSGDDFQTPMALMKDGFAIAGNDATLLNNFINARIIKTNFNGDVIWTGDHVQGGDQNDCVFAMAKTADDRIVIAGNNDRNGEDYVVLEVAPDCVPPPSNRVARYTFNEFFGRALDSDYYNNAVWYGGPTPVTGVVSSALSFDGVNDYTEAAPQPQIGIGTGDFTIQTWIRVKPADTRFTRSILDKRVFTGFGALGFAPLGYHIALINGVLWLQMADRGPGTGGYSNFSSTINVADGQWHFVSVTVTRASKSGIRWYLDGVPVSSGTADPTGRTRSLTNIAPLRFGRRNDGGGDPGWFKGTLDELEIFNRALTATEVADTFGAGSTGRCQ